MHAQPQPQHQWLQRLVGNWTYVVEMPPGSEDMPADSKVGSESVRGIGGLWILAEGKGKTPDGKEANMFLTLGYDPDKQTFVGSWFGSMMTMFWTYTGTLVNDTLTLETVGPDWERPGESANYREVIALQSDDRRTFTSFVQKPDGEWKEMMKMVSTRVK